MLKIMPETAQLTTKLRGYTFPDYKGRIRCGRGLKNLC